MKQDYSQVKRMLNLRCCTVTIYKVGKPVRTQSELSDTISPGIVRYSHYFSPATKNV